MATTKHSKRDDDTPDVTVDEPTTGTLAAPVHTAQQPGTSTLHLPFVTASFTRTPGRSGVPNPLSIVAGVAGAAGDALGAAVSVVPRKKVIFYTGVAALGVAGVVDWPVVAVVAAGTYVASRSGGRDDASDTSVHTELSATTSS